MNLPANPPMIIMGVSGCGKSTVGRLLGEKIGSVFIDGDDLHPASNKEKMAAGHPLTDVDREPWLTSIGQELFRSSRGPAPAVIACSALRRNYRDLLRSHEPSALFIHLRGATNLIQHRLDERSHAYMPPTLLASQLDTLEALEADEHAIEIDVSLSPEEIVELLVGQVIPQ